MKNIRLLYLSANQATVYRWQAGHLSSEAVFAAMESGHQQFAEYLADHPRSVFLILANVSEEGFQTETIPYLRGEDRQAVIRRKIGQLFFNARLTASLSLGYEKSSRKDERLFLAALSNNDFFNPWLKAIEESGIALAGIYSLPLLAPAMLKKMRIADDQCLLLTIQDQSLRQSYFEKGELHFSRLTPLHNSSIAGIAQAFHSEALKLHQYLTSQRLIGRNQPITAHILAHPSALKALQQSCINTPTVNFNILSSNDCAADTGLKTPPADTHCEPIFLNLMVASPPRIQFADDEIRHNYHLRQIRSALHVFGAFALIGCLLFSGKLLFETYTTAGETEALRNEAGLSRQRYETIVKTFPVIPTDNDTLRRVMDRYTELEKRSSSPEGLYYEISRALQISPIVELDSIDWKVGGVETPPGGSAGPAPASPSVPADSEAAIVRGTLKLGANANPRQMLDIFNKLVEALKTNPKLQVDVLKRPFDIESGKLLKGGDTTVEDNKPRSFTLQITRKIGP